LAHLITARSMTMLPGRRWSAPPPERRQRVRIASLSLLLPVLLHLDSPLGLFNRSSTILAVPSRPPGEHSRALPRIGAHPLGGRLAGCSKNSPTRRLGSASKFRPKGRAPSSSAIACRARTTRMVRTWSLLILTSCNTNLCPYTPHAASR